MIGQNKPKLERKYPGEKGKTSFSSQHFLKGGHISFGRHYKIVQTNVHPGDLRQDDLQEVWQEPREAVTGQEGRRRQPPQQGLHGSCPVQGKLRILFLCNCLCSPRYYSFRIPHTTMRPPSSSTRCGTSSGCRTGHWRGGPRRRANLWSGAWTQKTGTWRAPTSWGHTTSSGSASSCLPRLNKVGLPRSYPFTNFFASFL